MNPVTTSYAYVYVLRSQKSGMLYTGCTTDLRKRLQEHETGKSPYTANRGPCDLIYYEATTEAEVTTTRENYSWRSPSKNLFKHALMQLLDVTG